MPKWQFLEFQNTISSLRGRKNIFHTVCHSVNQVDFTKFLRKNGDLTVENYHRRCECHLDFTSNPGISEGLCYSSSIHPVIHDSATVLSINIWEHEFAKYT